MDEIGDNSSVNTDDQADYRSSQSRISQRAPPIADEHIEHIEKEDHKEECITLEDGTVDDASQESGNSSSILYPNNPPSQISLSPNYHNDLDQLHLGNVSNFIKVQLEYLKREDYPNWIVLLPTQSDEIISQILPKKPVFFKTQYVQNSQISSPSVVQSQHKYRKSNEGERIDSQGLKIFMKKEEVKSQVYIIKLKNHKLLVGIHEGNNSLDENILIDTPFENLFQELIYTETCDDFPIVLLHKVYVILHDLVYCKVECSTIFESKEPSQNCEELKKKIMLKIESKGFRRFLKKVQDENNNTFEIDDIVERTIQNLFQHKNYTKEEPFNYEKYKKTEGSIYILELPLKHYYVGFTLEKNPSKLTDSINDENFSPKWVKPSERNLIFRENGTIEQAEDITIQLMKYLGWEKVRGGRWNKRYSDIPDALLNPFITEWTAKPKISKHDFGHEEGLERVCNCSFEMKHYRFACPDKANRSKPKSLEPDCNLSDDRKNFVNSLYDDFNEIKASFGGLSQLEEEKRTYEIFKRLKKESMIFEGLSGDEQTLCEYYLKDLNNQLKIIYNHSTYN